MSTAQVPGYVAANNDHLHDGCWAERTVLGSRRLLLVDHIDDDIIYYSEHDLGSVTSTPSLSVMTRAGFMVAYSDAGWTWHDKSPKPAVAARAEHSHAPDSPATVR